MNDPRNIWHLDIHAYSDRFFQNLAAHGLADSSLGAGHPLNVWSRALVGRAMLDRIHDAYLRRKDGAKVAGVSFHVTFVAEKPTGSPGRDFSRICVGSTSNKPSSGALGIMPYDPGNQRVENADALDRLGVLAGLIYGMRSWLGPKDGGALKVADLRYLDGTYLLGAGTAAEDQRFLIIRKVLADWGTALGNVAAHEIGHSVGLLHDDASRNLMISRITYSMLSDESLAFAATARSRLKQNLGISR